MSSDNYLIIRQFGEHDFKLFDLSASDDREPLWEELHPVGTAANLAEAIRTANEYMRDHIVEYGMTVSEIMADYTTSDRGFKQYEPITTDYGHKLRVYESSAAREPCVWLAVDGRDTTNGDNAEVRVHMTIEQVRALRKALDAAILNHYQGIA